MSHLETTIHMKSGATIVMPLDGITTGRNVVSGEISKMNWTHTDNEFDARLQYIDLSQVAAIVTEKKDHP